jgi:hypothetical protein
MVIDKVTDKVNKENKKVQEGIILFSLFFSPKELHEI